MTQTVKTVKNSHSEVDLVHQCDDEGVQVPQEEGEDPAQLPLQGHPRVVLLQRAEGLKQQGAEHPQQRHHHVHLSQEEMRGGGEALTLDLQQH